jgi:hypothetical protein
MRSLLAAIADKYDLFMMDVWPFLRWIVYAYLAVFALFFVNGGGLGRASNRLACDIAHWTDDRTAIYRWADCDSFTWFPKQR